MSYKFDGSSWMRTGALPPEREVAVGLRPVWIAGWHSLDKGQGGTANVPHSLGRDDAGDVFMSAYLDTQDPNRASYWHRSPGESDRFTTPSPTVATTVWQFVLAIERGTTRTAYALEQGSVVLSSATDSNVRSPGPYNRKFLGVNASAAATPTFARMHGLVAEVAVGVGEPTEDEIAMLASGYSYEFLHNWRDRVRGWWPLVTDEGPTPTDATGNGWDVETFGGSPVFSVDHPTIIRKRSIPLVYVG